MIRATLYHWRPMRNRGDRRTPPALRPSLRGIRHSNHLSEAAHNRFWIADRTIPSLYPVGRNNPPGIDEILGLYRPFDATFCTARRVRGDGYHHGRECVGALLSR